jgi:glycosyltransferase involved in cell wall biosynthesis
MLKSHESARSLSGVLTAMSGDGQRSSSIAALDILKRKVPRVLICADYFDPAYHAGGAALALSASVRALDERFDQWIITRNHDLGNRQPYAFLGGKDLRFFAESWRPLGNAKVWYAPTTWSAIVRLPSLVRRFHPDLLYLNSVFSPFTRGLLIWRRLGIGVRVPVLLAARGELAPEARRTKKIRKNVWIGIARAMGLFNNIRWQASSNKEAIEIQSFLKRWRIDGRVVVVPEIVAVPKAGDFSKREKQAGSIRLCILGRVSPIKNLDGVLRALLAARGRFTVDVIGPVEDTAYAATCRALQDRLPPNVDWRWHGAISPDRALSQLELADVLAAPSHSENFGHAIAEALTRGLPVIVGENTPWSDVQRHGAGWAIASTDDSQLREVLESACALTGAAFAEMSECARRFAARRIVPGEAVECLDQALRATIAESAPDHSNALS